MAGSLALCALLFAALWLLELVRHLRPIPMAGITPAM
jgi:hypothetical protein